MRPPVSNGISTLYKLTIRNEYGKEEPVIAYWNDIDKRWITPGGEEIKQHIRLDIL